MSWEDDALERWYEDAFDFRVVGGKKGLNADGTSREDTNYWSHMKRRAEELIPNRPVRPGIDYALSEVVHCKSQGEEGVNEAVKVCTERYLLPVLKASVASVIVVVGKSAKKAIASYMHIPPPDPRLVGPVRLGSQDRYFAFIGHPSSSLPKTLATCLLPEEVAQLRQVVAKAGQPPIAPPLINPRKSDAPALGPSSEVPKGAQAEQRRNTTGLWSLMVTLLAVACLGYWS
jgi:hypothetical protein